MGITTGWGGGSRLVNIVGRKRALQLLLTANKVNYGNALDIGLIDSSISDYVVSKIFDSEKDFPINFLSSKFLYSWILTFQCKSTKYYYNTFALCNFS